MNTISLDDALSYINNFSQIEQFKHSMVQTDVSLFESDVIGVEENTENWTIDDYLNVLPTSLWNNNIIYNFRLEFSKQEMGWYVKYISNNNESYFETFNVDKYEALQTTFNNILTYDI